MPAEKVTNIGVALSFTPAGGSLTAIPPETLFSVTPPAPTRPNNEYKPLAAEFASFRPGQGDRGQLLFSIYYDPADASHQALLELMEDRTLATWTLTNADSGTTDESWLGYVESHSQPEIVAGGQLIKQFTIKITED